MRGKKDNLNIEDRIEKALLKKAVGYDTTETVEEYTDNEGEIRLVKKKVTKKSIPPDIGAIKMIMESVPSVQDMTDDQLEEERQRLLKILSEESKKEQ